jgi:hypothetical protein
MGPAHFSAVVVRSRIKLMRPRRASRFNPGHEISTALGRPCRGSNVADPVDPVAVANQVSVQDAGPGAVVDGRTRELGAPSAALRMRADRATTAGTAESARDGRGMRKSHQRDRAHSRVFGTSERSGEGPWPSALPGPYWRAVPIAEPPGLASLSGDATGAVDCGPARFDRAGSPAYTALRLTRSWREARREAHLSAEQDRPQAAARVSRAHGLGRRPPGARSPTGQRAPAAVLLSPAARHARRRTARIIPGWFASSVGGSSWPQPPARIAGWRRRSCSRPGPGRPPTGRAAAPRSAWASRRAAGSARRSRATGPGAGFWKRPGASSQVPPSRGTTTSSSRGRQS